MTHYKEKAGNMPKIKGSETVYFGNHKEYGDVELCRPTWDCGWYWSFGYLGNENCHFHLGNMPDMKRLVPSDLHKDFTELNQNLEDNDAIWTFCELVNTAYILKETAEMLGRGGAHFTRNPLDFLIQNQEEVQRIQTEVLPAIFNQISELLEG